MSKKKKTNSKKSSQVRIFRGRLDISRSGMGFVIVEELDKDILVRPHDFGKAFHGDTVRVQVAVGGSTAKRWEGVVTEVVERKQTTFAGHIHLNKNIAFFEPSSERYIPDFFIPLHDLNGAQHGDRVMVRLVKWDKEDRKPQGSVEQILTSQNEADLAMKEILIDAGFNLEFDESIMQEAALLNDTITEQDLEQRKDCRDILTFTIDPVDAKDFDDALSFRRMDDGLLEIGVHIADVSHFVRPGTLLDEEAYLRATSVYLPDRVNPMLPERISNELCSLRPREDKFTFSAIFIMNEKAEIKKHWIGRTLIHSNHRFTYEEVQEIIETRQGLYQEEILLLNELAQTFRKKRFDNGAINFSSTEVRFKLDETGKPIGIVVKESKRVA